MNSETPRHKPEPAPAARKEPASRAPRAAEPGLPLFLHAAAEAGAGLACGCAIPDCPVCGGHRVQRKLAVGMPDDPLEAEADRVADTVLAAPTQHAVGGAAPSIQRFAGSAGGEAGSAPASAERVLAGPGAPLEAGVRQDMEARFGQDFSNVRVHADAAAEGSARELNADAWTAGRSIVFGAGRYAPGTADGRRLLAHELTHVVQQGAAGSAAGGVIRRSMATYVKAMNRKPEPDFALAAEHLNGESVADIRIVLKNLSPDHRVKLHRAARVWPGVCSNVARLTEADFLKVEPTAPTAATVCVAAPATPATGPASGAATPAPKPVDPLLPEGGEWADNFEEAFYDIEYRINEGGSPSNWLRVRYENGTVIDLNWYEFTRGKLSPDDFIAALRDRKERTGGIVFPAKLSKQTTPRLYAAYEEMTDIGAQSTIDLMLLSLPAVMFVITIGMPVGPTAPGGAAPAAARRGVPRGGNALPPRTVANSLPAQQARQMAAEMEAAGEPVVVNLGGAGRPHEPPGAININNQAVKRSGIPKLVEADGADVGELLGPATVDRVEGHRMAGGVIDWTRGAPGSFRVLKSGGKFRFSYQGATDDAVKLAAELEKAGFKDVSNQGNALVTATKP